MKTLLVTAGREIVKQISNGCQGLPLLMKDRTDYRETYEKWVTNSDQEKRFTFKGRFKYLFALNNRSEQILTFSVKPKLHTSYILIFFSTIL